MGREIRRVPEGWDHPRHEPDTTPPHTHRRLGQYRPLCDRPFAEAMREWIDEWESWERGDRPDYFNAAEYPDGIEFHEWHGGPPDPEYYRPAWNDEDVTHYQFYETVSEGTPLSPPMPSLEALAEWLTTHECYWGKQMTAAQAQAFCKSGWAPSMVIQGGTMMTGIEFVAQQSASQEAPATEEPKP